MAEEAANLSRRKFLKGAAYAVPLVVGFTLVGNEVANAWLVNQSSSPKGRRPRRNMGPYEGEYDGQGSHGDSGGPFPGRP